MLQLAEFPYVSDMLNRQCLPLWITEQLVTDEQAAWWSAAYKVSTNNTREGVAQLRNTLRKGIEALRLSGTLSLHLDTIINLARTFAALVRFLIFTTIT